MRPLIKGRLEEAEAVAASYGRKMIAKLEEKIRDVLKHYSIIVLEVYFNWLRNPDSIKRYCKWRCDLFRWFSDVLLA